METNAQELERRIEVLERLVIALCSTNRLSSDEEIVFQKLIQEYAARKVGDE